MSCILYCMNSPITLKTRNFSTSPQIWLLPTSSHVLWPLSPLLSRSKPQALSVPPGCSACFCLWVYAFASCSAQSPLPPGLHLAGDSMSNVLAQISPPRSLSNSSPPHSLSNSSPVPWGVPPHFYFLHSYFHDLNILCTFLCFCVYYALLRHLWKPH